MMTRLADIWCLGLVGLLEKKGDFETLYIQQMRPCSNRRSFEFDHTIASLLRSGGMWSLDLHL